MAQATTPAVRRVLIVGSGLTGSALSMLLRESPLVGSGAVEFEIWEKSRGAGGRASTSRFEQGSADTGLQYLSTQADPLHPIYAAMLRGKVIAPMTARLGGNNAKYMDPGLKHFVSVNGASGLAKHLLSTANTVPSYGVEVADLSVVGPDDGNGAPRWRATTTTGTTKDFDGVVLTPPVPQILALAGDVQAKLAANAELFTRMQNVSYSSRWALALRFPIEAWAAVKQLDFDARYVGKDESAAICYLSVDQLKRGRDPDELSAAGEGPVLLIHAGVPWSLKHGAGTTKADEAEGLRSDVQTELMMQAGALLPGLMDGFTPTDTKLQKWLYSQVYKGLVGGTGAAVIDVAPLLIVSGDGFAGSSGFDRCVASAAEASRLVLSHI